jgi:hypothetical protein
VAITSYPLAEGKSGTVLLSYDVTRNSVVETRHLVINVQ